MDKLLYNINKTNTWKNEQRALARENRPPHPYRRGAYRRTDRNTRQLIPEVWAQNRVLAVGDLTVITGR